MNKPKRIPKDLLNNQFGTYNDGRTDALKDVIDEINKLRKFQTGDSRCTFTEMKSIDIYANDLIKRIKAKIEEELK